MTLQPRCEDVETAEGVAITVTGVAQVRPDPSVFSVNADTNTNTYSLKPSLAYLSNIICYQKCRVLLQCFLMFSEMWPYNLMV